MKYIIEIPDKAIEQIANIKRISRQNARSIIIAYLETIAKNLPEAMVAVMDKSSTKLLSDKLAKDVRLHLEQQENQK